MQPNEDYVLRVLEDVGLVTPAQLQSARTRLNGSTNVRDVLVRDGLISETDVSRTLAAQAHMDWIDLSTRVIPPEVISQIRAGDARRFKVIPVGFGEMGLIVAVSDPLDIDTIDSLSFLLQREIELVCTSPDKIREALIKYYGSADEAFDVLARRLGQDVDFGLEIGDGGEISEGDEVDAPIIRLVSMLLIEAHRLGASDIHLEPLEKKDRRLQTLRRRLHFLQHTVDAKADAELIIEVINRPNGIFIVTGPTGSGKTTTLYSCLRKINTIDSKLLTAEEPVEYDLEGVVQVPVNEGIGLSFARVLRAFLRQDPDRIMVGETRDLETAQIAIQASLTGHLVFTTLHTNDAPGAVTRLIDMGVEPFLISSTLEAVLGQRLLRSICPHCRTTYQQSQSFLEQLQLSRRDIGEKNFFYGKGCEVCNNTGYKGRKGIYELMKITDPLRELINERAPTVVLKQKAVELGMVTLRQDGVRSIFEGDTTIEEVLKYT